MEDHPGRPVDDDPDFRAGAAAGHAAGRGDLPAAHPEEPAVALDGFQRIHQHSAPGSSVALQIGEFTDSDCFFRRRGNGSRRQRQNQRQEKRNAFLHADTSRIIIRISVHGTGSVPYHSKHRHYI